MINIEAKTIPHNEHRYPTVGDYWEQNKNDIISTQYRVSDMGNSDYELLVLIHEMIESYLCKKRGINWGDIDAFDKTFETQRTAGNVDEPGDNPNAPYYKEHVFATCIERLIALELGIDWKTYSDIVESL